MSGFVRASGGHHCPAIVARSRLVLKPFILWELGTRSQIWDHWVIYNNESGPSFAIVLLSRPPQI